LNLRILRERLLSLVYRELRRRAITHMRRERPGHALQPTDLVHETYLRLVEQNRIVWQDRSQFFRIASEIMRRILVDQARARLTGKRSGQWSRVSFDEGAAVLNATDVDVLDLDAALTRLATFDARKSQIAELRFFVGLSRSSGAPGVRPWTSELGGRVRPSQ
jgi:RNA polymerase sigma-70 factor (ECF subfamily)